jgi:hypothetical protein
MGRISGTNLRVYMSGKPIGYATSCTLSTSIEMTSIIHKDSTGNTEEVDPSTVSWSMSTTGFISEDEVVNGGTVTDRVDLITAALARTRLTLYWRTETTADRYLTGFAYIDSYEENAEVNATGTYTVNFKGDGALTAGDVT